MVKTDLFLTNLHDNETGEVKSVKDMFTKINEQVEAPTGQPDGTFLITGGNGQLNAATFKDSQVQRNDIGIISTPDGGYEKTVAEAIYGAVAIRLPKKFSGTQVAFDVTTTRLGNSSKIHISAYLSSTNGWSSVKAVTMAGEAVRVRFGSTATNAMVYLGDDGANGWARVQCAVSNVQVGLHDSNLDDWNKNWDVSVSNNSGTPIVAENVTSDITSDIAYSVENPVIPANTTADTVLMAGANGALTAAPFTQDQVQKLNLGVIPVPEGGVFIGSQAVYTGAVEITLPQGYTSSQISFTVLLQEEPANRSTRVFVNGYQSTTNNTWYGTAHANVTGGHATDMKVRFGHKTVSGSDKLCVYIGENNENWDYPNIFISDVCIGYQNTEYDKWATGWSIGFVSAPQNVTTTVTAYRSYSPQNSPVPAGTTAGTVLTSDASGLLAAAPFKESNVQRNDLGTIPTPAGAYHASTGAETGVIKVQLPKDFSADVMLSFDVNVVEFNSNKAVKLHISGHASNGNTDWEQVTATSNSVSNDYLVRFGIENSKLHVYIGESTTVWSYPQVSVSNFTYGYGSTTSADWATGWNISIGGDASTVTATTTAYATYSSANPVIPANTAANKMLVAGTNGALAVATFDHEAVQLNTVGTIPAPSGAHHESTLANETGVIAIKLPQLWSGTMQSFTVSVYNYQANTAATFKIGCYNSAYNSEWANCTATVEGTGENYRVRFGDDGTNAIVYIGETTTVWNYPVVSVHNWTGGYDNFEPEKWRSGWTIDVTTSVQNVLPENDLIAYSSYSKGNSLVPANVPANSLLKVDSAGDLQDSGILSEADGSITIKPNSMKISYQKLGASGEGMVVKNTATDKFYEVMFQETNGNWTPRDRQPVGSPYVYERVLAANATSTLTNPVVDYVIADPHDGSEGYLYQEGGLITIKPAATNASDIILSVFHKKGSDYTLINEINFGAVTANVDKTTTIIDPFSIRYGEDYRITVTAKDGSNAVVKGGTSIDNVANFPYYIVTNDAANGYPNAVRKWIGVDSRQDTQNVVHTTQSMNLTVEASELDVLIMTDVKFTHAGEHSCQIHVDNLHGRFSDGCKLLTRIYQIQPSSEGSGTKSLGVFEFEQDNVGTTAAHYNFKCSPNISSASIIKVTMQTIDATGTVKTSHGDVTLIIKDKVETMVGNDGYVRTSGIRPTATTHLGMYGSEFKLGNALGRTWNPNGTQSTSRIVNNELYINNNGGGHSGRMFNVDNSQDFCIATHVMRSGHLQNGMEAGIILLEDDTASSQMLALVQAGDADDIWSDVRVQTWSSTSNFTWTELDKSCDNPCYFEIHYDSANNRAHVRYSPDGNIWFLDDYYTLNFTPTKYALSCYAGSGGNVISTFEYARYQNKSLNTSEHIPVWTTARVQGA